jgi:hypothetical protein
MRLKFTRRRILAYSLLFPLVAYALVELTFTALVPVSAGTVGPNTFWIIEDKDSVRFDPILGYRISQNPVRFARVTNGTVEYVGTFHGNAQGFHSAKDFTVKKPAGIKHRDILLGDCFSSGTYIEKNWPTRVEASFADRELLNFSVDGVGLANWWSILARYIEPNQYEFDSVIFAAIANDLNRPFVVADCRRDTSVMIGYSVWSPDSFALDSKKAFHILNYLTMRKVSPVDFDASIAEGRLHQGSERRSLTRPRLATWVAHELFPAPMPLKEPPPYTPACPVPKVRPCSGDGSFNALQMSIILDIRDRLARRHTPVTVIYIPGRDELLAHRDESARVRRFAELLGARFLDGSAAYRALKETEIRACYLPYDGHWNQKGSDRFANFVANNLKEPGR